MWGGDECSAPYYVYPTLIFIIYFTPKSLQKASKVLIGFISP